eukprot:6197365-Pleurochrysis_carterae.AAC.1
MHAQLPVSHGLRLPTRVLRARPPGVLAAPVSSACSARALASAAQLLPAHTPAPPFAADPTVPTVVWHGLGVRTPCRGHSRLSLSRRLPAAPSRRTWTQDLLRKPRPRLRWPRVACPRSRAGRWMPHLTATALAA